MGSGQSKFYKSASKHQYPFGPPPLPGPYNQQPFHQFGPLGYGPSMYPQQMPGFIPPGAYGQGAQLPPPLLDWMPQDRRRSRRKSRRRDSEKFVGGFGAEQRRDSRRTHSESHRRDERGVPPVIPKMQMPVPEVTRVPPEPERRTATPFVPQFSRAPADDELDRSRSRSQHGHSSGHGHSRPESRQSVSYSPPHSINGDFAHVMQPLEPANSSAFGPTGQRPNVSLSNPLPPPPRDIYEMSPYKSLLTMPHTSALLTASYGPHVATVNPIGQPAKVERKKSIGKSLLRAFSKKEKKPEAQPQVHFVPVYVQGDKDPTQTESYPTETAQQAADLIRTISQVRAGVKSQPMHATAPPPQSVLRRTSAGVHHTAGLSTTSVDAAYPPVPPDPSVIYFNQDSPYSVFMNHSPHRVPYRGKLYPTAAHLFEAFKYVDQHPDIAEQIRQCPDITSLYEMTTKYASSARADWGYVHLGIMDEVLLIKFRAHVDLRTKLFATGDASLVYSDRNDTFWGIGANGDGQNLMGKALARIRDKLRMEFAMEPR